MTARGSRRAWLGLAAAALALTGWSLLARDPDALVVYCAHDSLYADEVLRRFERETGIPVQVRYDTEATKSLGLVETIARERHNPRCDVFWNNEVLGTMRLAEEGLLVPYRGPGWARIPSRYRDPDARWVGFAGRLRVWIVRPDRVEPTPGAVAQAVAARIAEGRGSSIALARPLYGTTRTQYTVQWQLWGGDALIDWHRRWRSAGVREVSGNATVKNLVAAGTCDLGLTDTDDYFLAVDAGSPVAMVPLEVGDGRAICVPNAVAIVRGCRRPEAARALVDFLASERTELALARSRSRQLPLGPVDEERLPDDVRALVPCLRTACDLADLGAARRACLDWLRAEYAR